MIKILLLFFTLWSITLQSFVLNKDNYFFELDDLLVDQEEMVHQNLNQPIILKNIKIYKETWHGPKLYIEANREHNPIFYYSYNSYNRLYVKHDNNYYILFESPRTMHCQLIEEMKTSIETKTYILKYEENPHEKIVFLPEDEMNVEDRSCKLLFEEGIKVFDELNGLVRPYVTENKYDGLVYFDIKLPNSTEYIPLSINDNKSQLEKFCKLILIKKSNRYICEIIIFNDFDRYDPFHLYVYLTEKGLVVYNPKDFDPEEGMMGKAYIQKRPEGSCSLM